MTEFERGFTSCLILFNATFGFDKLEDDIENYLDDPIAMKNYLLTKREEFKIRMQEERRGRLICCGITGHPYSPHYCKQEA